MPAGGSQRNTCSTRIYTPTRTPRSQIVFLTQKLTQPTTIISKINYLSPVSETHIGNISEMAKSEIINDYNEYCINDPASSVLLEQNGQEQIRRLTRH